MTVNIFLFEIVDISSVRQLGTTKCQGKEMFSDRRSWFNFHSWPVGFLTGKMEVLHRLLLFSH